MSARWIAWFALLPFGCSYAPDIAVYESPQEQKADFLIRFPEDVSALLVTVFTVSLDGQQPLWQVKPRFPECLGGSMSLSYGTLPKGADQIYPKEGASPPSIHEGDIVWVSLSCSGGTKLAAPSSTADQFRFAKGRFIKLKPMPAY